MLKLWLLLSFLLILAPVHALEPGCCVYTDRCESKLYDSQCDVSSNLYLRYDERTCDSLLDCALGCCCNDVGKGDIIPAAGCDTECDNCWSADDEYKGTPAACNAFCNDYTPPVGPPVLPPEQTASVSGTVKTPAGAGVQGVKVEIKQENTVRGSAFTDRNGAYRVSGIPKNNNPVYYAWATKQSCTPSDYSSNPFNLPGVRTGIDMTMSCDAQECSPGIPEITRVMPTFGQREASISFKLDQNPNCEKDITGIVLERYAGIPKGTIPVWSGNHPPSVWSCFGGECTVPYNIEDNFGSQMTPNTPYCYKVKFFYDGSSIVESEEKNEYCFISGDEDCLKDNVNNPFCLNNKELARCTQGGVLPNGAPNINFLVQRSNCLEKYCIIKEGRAQCTSAVDCDQCTGFLGMFSFLNPRVTIEQAPGNALCSNTDLTYCYSEVGRTIDTETPTSFARSIVDSSRSCVDVSSCSDYRSKDACDDDPCTTTTETCYWSWSYEVFGLGFCTLAGQSTPDLPGVPGKCEQCTLDECDYNACKNIKDENDISECVFNDQIRLPREQDLVNSLNSQCLGKNNFACRFYDTEEECVNKDGNKGEHSIVVQYSDGKRTGGTHVQNTLSNDFFGFGKCKWIENQCIKDADGDDLDDCVHYPQNRDILKCHQDTNPPETTIYLVTGNLRGAPRYSFKDMRKGNFFSVFDEEGNYMSDSRFCFTMADEPCYPTLSLQQINADEIDSDHFYRMYYYSFDAANNLEVVQGPTGYFMLYDDGTPYVLEATADGVDLTIPNSRITVPNPRIYLKFSEAVDITDMYVLEDATGIKVQVNGNRNNVRDGEFTLESYLSPGKQYTLFIAFTGKSLPRLSEVVQYPFSITGGDITITLVTDSDIKTYPSQSPYMGVASTLNYLLQVRTPSKPHSSCMVGANLEGDMFDMRNSGADPHLKFLTRAGTELSLPNNKDYPDELKRIWVKCVNDGSFSFQDFLLGMDTTPPSINPASPKVDNYGNPKSVLTIVSNDQVICNYTVALPQGPERYPVPIDTYNSLANYKKTNRIVLDFKKIGDLPHPQNLAKHFVPVYITCYNTAGLSTIKHDFKVEVEFSAVFTINIVSPDDFISGAYFRDNTPITIRTSQDTTGCTYILNDVPNKRTGAFTKNTAREYTLTLSGLLLNGENELSITCQDTKGWVTSNFTFFADKETPSKLLVESRNSVGCNPRALYINMSAFDEVSGIAGFKVNVTGDGVNVKDASAKLLGSNENVYRGEYEYTNPALKDKNGKQYTFRVVAYDHAGNSVDKTFTLTQNYLDKTCYVPLRILPDFPIYGVHGTAESFKPKVSTDRPAECRWSLEEPAFSHEAYLRMSGFFEETKNGGFSRVHTMTQQYAYSRYIWLFCYDETGFMHLKKVYFGHDFTPPVFRTIEVKPELLRDFTNKTVELRFTTDDNTVCWLDNTPIGEFDRKEYANYTKEHYILLDYSHINDFEKRDFVHTLKCRNGANPGQDLTTVRINVTVHLTDEVLIEMISPREFDNPTSVNFAVKTNLPATCSYKAAGMSDFRPLTKNQLVHSASLGNLAEGMHSVIVECMSGTKISITDPPLSFFIDRQKPEKPVLETNDPQCGRTAVTVKAVSNDSGSGLAGFNYTLRRTSSQEDVLVDKGFVQSNAVATIRFDREILNGSTYYWHILALDKARNPSDPTSASVRILDPRDVVCDFGKPTALLNWKYHNKKTDVSVDCRDSHSGCNPSFKYSAVKQNETCTPEVDGQLNRTITLYETSKFCFTVFDMGTQHQTGQRLIKVYDLPDHCFNQVQDGNETGVDCGGPCIPCESAACGDGKVNAPGEQCDGTDFGKITGCTDPIFGSDFTGGSLQCSEDCRIITTQCSGSAGLGCGDGLVSPGEHCEGTLSKSCKDIYPLSTGGLISCGKCLLDTLDCAYPGVSCKVNSDCMSGVCRSGMCAAATCHDGIKNGAEGGIDCGGDCPRLCKLGSDCVFSTDCESGYCNDGICAVASCDDGIKNGDETGVDCGGSCPDRCPGGQGCKSNNDCLTGYCDMLTSPHTCIDNPDSDQDGIPDECEILWGMDPYDPSDAYEEYDHDELDNKGEYSVSLRRSGKCHEATDIRNPDTDGDGFSDGMEVRMGYDPLDPKDHPPKNIEDPTDLCALNRYCVKDKTPVAVIILLVVGIILLAGGIGFQFAYKYRNQIFANTAVRQLANKLKIKLPEPKKPASPKPIVPEKPAPVQAVKPVQKPLPPPPQQTMDKDLMMRKKRISQQRDELQKKIRESFK